MLRHASAVAQAWCRMMLDTRGGTLMTEQVQNRSSATRHGQGRLILSWNGLTS